MLDHLDELAEIRLRLDKLESRADSESALRATTDLKQAELTWRLESHNNLLRALGSTQREHTSRLIRLEEGQTRLEEGQVRLEVTYAHLAEGQSRLDQRQGRLETVCTSLVEGQSRLETGLQAVLGLLQRDEN